MTSAAARTEGAPEEDDSLAKAYFGEAIFSAIYDHITPANLCEWQRESPDMAIGLPQRVAFDALVDEVWNSIPPPSPAATVPESMVLVRREDAQTALVALTRAADNSYDPEGQAWLRAAHGAIEKALRADLTARAEPAKE